MGYGASINDYPHDYLTAACAVGLSATELDEFLLRLDKAIRKVKGDRGAVVEGFEEETVGGGVVAAGGGAAGSGEVSVAGEASQDMTGNIQDTQGTSYRVGGATISATIKSSSTEGEDWDNVD